ncbi:MAG: TOBE domain-containing protein [Clostridia bacterium]|nr:TOBE domain-containing protein [Clostridia bacterium]MBR6479855.1 TOBE domain-containing protein [Clostridia bacterium]
MKLSARNQLKGKVVKVTEGAVNGIVVIDVNGTEISADITMASIRELGLKPGKEAYAIIKASNVMVGIDHDEEAAPAGGHGAAGLSAE